MRRSGIGRWTFRLALAAALAVGAGYLPYRLYGPQGVARVHRLARDLRRLDDANQSLERENRALRLQIRSLKDDRSTIERVARDELGMVRPGDVVFQIQR